MVTRFNGEFIEIKLTAIYYKLSKNPKALIATKLYILEIIKIKDFV